MLVKSRFSLWNISGGSSSSSLCLSIVLLSDPPPRRRTGLPLPLHFHGDDTLVAGTLSQTLRGFLLYCSDHPGRRAASRPRD